MRAKNVVYAGLFIACGVMLPQIFHMIGGPGLGGILLPMHIPVLIAGFVLGPVWALLVGLLTPICSFLYTGGAMPAVPMLYFMILELGAYGLGASLLSKKLKQGIFVSLIGAMIFGRVVRGIAFVVATQLLAIPLAPVFGITVAITQGIPGIIIQLILIPPVMLVIKKKGWLCYDETRA
ncbi:MAG: ECF transporter S component [Cellulosilyticaceae bacterium]